MTAVDTNLLIYAHRRESAFHARAAVLLRGLADGTARWAIPWTCIHEFYGVATHPRVFSPPSTPAEALHQVEVWLESPSLVLLGEDHASWSHLRELLGTTQVRGPKVHDARIAALCLRHGVSELWSADRDFSRFPALRVRNPLVG